MKNCKESEYFEIAGAKFDLSFPQELRKDIENKKIYPFIDEINLDLQHGTFYGKNWNNIFPYVISASWLRLHLGYNLHEKIINDISKPNFDKLILVSLIQNNISSIEQLQFLNVPLLEHLILRFDILQNRGQQNHQNYRSKQVRMEFPDFIKIMQSFNYEQNKTLLNNQSFQDFRYLLSYKIKKMIKNHANFQSEPLIQIQMCQQSCLLQRSDGQFLPQQFYLIYCVNVSREKQHIQNALTEGKYLIYAFNLFMIKNIYFKRYLSKNFYLNQIDKNSWLIKLFGIKLSYQFFEFLIMFYIPRLYHSMGCQISYQVGVPKLKENNRTESQPSGRPNKSSEFSDYGEFADHYRELREQDLKEDPYLKKLVDSMEMHERRTWTPQYDALCKLGDKYRHQKKYIKEIETRVEAQKICNHFWVLASMAYGLLGSEQYRLALKVFKYAKQVLEVSDDQQLKKSQMKNYSEEIQKYDKKCSEVDPLLRGLKCYHKYWDLYNRINKQSDYQKRYALCEQMKKFMPCDKTGYHRQNFAMMFQKKFKRDIDFDKYEQNRLMIKKFKDKAYNKPDYENYERDLARSDAQYGIYTGRIDEFSKGNRFIYYDSRFWYEDRIIKYELKISDFDEELKWKSNKKIVYINYPRNIPYQKRLKFQVIHHAPGIKFTETDDFLVMEKDTAETPLPKQVIFKAQVFLKAGSYFRKGLVPLKQYTGSDPEILKWMGLEGTKVDQPYIDMIMEWTKDYKDLSVKIDVCIEKIVTYFKYAKGPQYSTVSELWKRGYGQCGEYAQLVHSICRIFKIPSRVISGIIYDNELNCHMVAQVYAQPFGEWIILQANQRYGARANYIRFQHYGDKDNMIWTSHWHFKGWRIVSYSNQYILSKQEKVY